jgi:hypothetical protein
MLLKKSPRKICRIQIRNNRIMGAGFLNRTCAFAAHVVSMLLGVPIKILFQQHRQALPFRAPLRWLLRLNEQALGERAYWAV